MTTRETILEAAVAVFSRDGFAGTTIREVCRTAGVNVAAVHYHFGSKEKLYEAVCREVCGGRPRFEIAPGQDPAARLRAFVTQFLTVLLGAGRSSAAGMIMGREMIEPTEALTIIVEDMFKPRFLQLCDIVRDLLGTGVAEEVVRRCALSVVGQCLYYRHSRPVVGQLNPWQTFDPSAVAELADHITRFSLGALASIGHWREPDA